MAVQEPLRLNIQSHNIMHALLSPLHSSNTLVQSKAALTVAATACDVEARMEVRVFITSPVPFFCRCINLKHFEVFETTHHLSPSKLVQHIGKQIGIIQQRR